LHTRLVRHGPPEQHVLLGKQADPMGAGHHSNNAAEQGPLEIEHRGYAVFPEATAGAATDLHLRTWKDG
jgi:hypothetical protein